MKKILLIVALLLTPFFQAQNTTFAADSKSACDSFGIQKSLEKKPAPLFSLKDMDGKEVYLADFRGKPVLVVFWATW